MNDLMVMVRIAGRHCALPAHEVSAIIEVGTVTSVPRSPDFIAGIAALRSQALTVVDCRLAIGFEVSSWPTDTRAAVVKIDGHTFALVVDAIEDITTRVTEPEHVTGGFGSNWARVATGMIETTLGPALLLDLQTLIEGPIDQAGPFGAAA